jgi:ureidoglycolate hydrolase
MDEYTIEIDAEPFDPAAWSAFGWTPVADTDPRDGDSRLHFEWDDVHVNLIGHDAAEVPYTEKGVVCEMFFRHHTHTQTLLVLNCPAVVAVAPPGCALATRDDLAEVRAFLVQPHDTFALHRGTWHWGPFPLVADRVEMFNVQGLRYAEDNDCARLATLGARIEIRTGATRPH